VKTCNKCGIEKELIDFSIRKTSSKDGYRTICKSCEKKYNRNVNVEYKKKYNAIYNKTYDKNRKNKDPIFRFSKNVRSLTYNGFKNNGFSKNSKTSNLLGISIKEFREYIINKFEEWMTLENQGIYNGNYNETWQLDHITPISTATTIEEVIKLSHYTNFQPLCSRKNKEKRNKN
jgi:hypothetical protein